MSSNKNEHSRKYNRHSYPAKRRLKSSIVRDPNGSISTFRQFYQSGGRDYEQYRLWLQTLSIPSVDFDKVKNEPTENEASLLPSTPLPQPFSTSETAVVHSILKPMRQFSMPIKSSHALPRRILPSSRLTIIPFESSLPITSSIVHWSVTDVGRFIERHFPEKTIARKFIEQKIDGRTLPLLTEDHLTRIFKMKLGPALHLLALISTLPK